jgi:uncharacterized caspase-like protein
MRLDRILLLAGGLTASVSAGGDDQDLLSRFGTTANVRRLAIVVGVQNYDEQPEVPNALNDARQIDNVLTSTGFEVAFLGDPRTSDDILLKVIALAERAGGEPANIVFFFAGHGFQEGPFNFLVPGKARRDEMLADSLPVTSVLQVLAGRLAASTGQTSGVTILMLDACRTLGDVRSPDKIGGHPGFGTIAVPAKATMVGLAAEYNSPAFSRCDQCTTNSPYTTALTHFIPGEFPIEKMFKRVQESVEKLTADKQTPELINKLAGEFSFRPTRDERTEQENEWRATLSTPRRECVLNYLRRYPDSRYVLAALALYAASHDTDSGGEECPEL